MSNARMVNRILNAVWDELSDRSGFDCIHAGDGDIIDEIQEALRKAIEGAIDP